MIRRSATSTTSPSKVAGNPRREGPQEDRHPLHHRGSPFRHHYVRIGLCPHELRYPATHSDNYNKSNFPTDSDNIPCAYGANKNYPFVYFPNINDISLVHLTSCSEFASATVPQLEIQTSAAESTPSYSPAMCPIFIVPLSALED